MKNKKQRGSVSLLRRFRADGPGIHPSREFKAALLDKMKAQVRPSHRMAAARPVARNRRLVYGAISSAAALVLLVVAAWVLVGPNVNSAAASFERMLQKIRSAKTVTYVQILRVPGQPTERWEVSQASRGRARILQSGEKITLFNHSEGRGLVLRPVEKKATLLKVPIGSGESDPLDDLRNIQESAGREIRTEFLAGIKTAVYEVALPRGTMTVWIDPSGNLPVRIEVETALSGGGQAVIVLDSFVWDPPLDDMLFAMDIPAGYSVSMPQDVVTQDALVDLLRTCAELGDNNFPPRLDSAAVSDLVMSRYGEAEAVYLSAKGTPSICYWKPGSAAESRFKACLPGLAFVQQAQEGSDWHYRGQGIKLGDAVTAICWWRPPGQGDYRVVFGDLTIKNVAPDQLPPSSGTQSLNQGSHP